jgi:uncharacterized membrane protein
VVDLATADPTPAAATERWPGRVAAAATVLAVVLVVADLGDKSLWYDEAFSIGIIDRPFGDALWRLAHWEVNQSPFYLLLAGWWRLGQSEVFLRSLAGAATVMAVPAMFVLGRRLLDARLGAIAAVLLAVHPMAISWGQQLRAYSLVLLLVIVATHLLLLAIERPDSAALAAGYAAVAALATYTHFFAGLVIASHGLWLLAQRPLPRRLVTTAAAVYAVLVAPLAWYLLTLEEDPLHWVTDRTGSAIVEVGRALTGGTRWSVLAYSVAAAVGLWAVVASVRATDRRDRWRTALPAIWLVAPVAAVTVSTATVKPLLEPRFLIVVVPGLVLVAALGVRSLRPRPAVGLLVAVLLASAWGLRSWYSEPTFEDWRSATRVMVDALEPDDPITIEPRGGVFAVRYYEGRLEAPEHRVIYPGPGDPPEGERLAEIQSEASVGGSAPLDPGYVAWRDEHYVLHSQHQAGKILVRTYQRR